MAPTGAMTPKQAGYNQVQIPRYSPQAMEMRDKLRGAVEPGALSGIEDISKIAGGDEDYFQQLQAPAMREFQALQGNIASRFSQAGARRSSGFQNEMSGAGLDFAERLQLQRLNLQKSARDQLLGLYGDIVSDDPYEMLLQEREPKKKWFNKYIGGGLRAAGASVGGYFGGPPGAKIGYEAGNALGNAFD